MDQYIDVTEPVVARPADRPAAQLNRAARLGWGLVGLSCTVVLAVAVWLTPDPRGYGTHEQLGGTFWPCPSLITTGLPCPTCGMTTAFAFMMHGRPAAAFVAQPAGAALCLTAIAAVFMAGYVVMTGKAVRINWDRVEPVRLTLGLAFFFLGGWGFKIAYGLLTGTLPAR